MRKALLLQVTTPLLAGVGVRRSDMSNARFFAYVPVFCGLVDDDILYRLVRGRFLGFQNELVLEQRPATG